MRERTLKVFSRISAASIFGGLLFAAVPLVARAWQEHKYFTQSPLLDGHKSVVEVHEGMPGPMSDVVKLSYRFVAGSKKVEAERATSAAAYLLDRCCLSLAIPLLDFNKSPSRWVLLNYRIFVVSVQPLVLVLVPYVFKLTTYDQAYYQANNDYDRLIARIPSVGDPRDAYLVVRLPPEDRRSDQRASLINRLEFTNLIPAVPDSLFVSADSNVPVPLEQALQSSKSGLHAIEKTIDGKTFLEFQ